MREVGDDLTREKERTKVLSFLSITPQQHPCDTCFSQFLDYFCTTNHKLFIVKLKLLALTSMLLLSCLEMTAKQRKAVFIILDGIPADVIERMNDQLPAIKEIASQGGYARAITGGIVGDYTETPTISAVGYANLLTSTWAYKHGVWDNAPVPNYNYWSIFRTAKQKNRPLKTALYSSWTDNRTKLLGEGLPATGNLKIDYVADGYDLDTTTYPREKDDMQIFRIDERISNEAANGIRTNAPDLSWVYLWYTDDAGHYYGNSDFLDRYVLLADRQVQRIWDAVKVRQAQYDEDWMVVVTTDHGRGNDGYHHGGQSARERTTWIATNVATNSHFQDGNLLITDIAPSICRHLRIAPPRAVEWEQEGVAFVGKTDISTPTSTLDANGSITLHWECLNSGVPVTVYYTTTDNFRTGGTDRWIKAGKTSSESGRFTFDQPNSPSTFYKFVIATPHTHLYRQLTLPAAK